MKELKAICLGINGESKKAVRVNWQHELEKVKRGKKTKSGLPVEIIVYESLRGHPHIQRKLAKAVPSVRAWASQ